jgi:hypothetical protein
MALLAVASTFWPAGWGFGAAVRGGGTLTGSGTNIGMLTIQRTAGLAARDNAERVRIFSWLGVAPSFSQRGRAGGGRLHDRRRRLPAPTRCCCCCRWPRWPARVSVPRCRRRRRGPARRRLGPAGGAGHEAAAGRQLAAVDVLGRAHLRRAHARPRARLQRQHHRADPRHLHAGGDAVRLLIPLLAHRLARRSRCCAVAMVGTALVFALYPLAPTPG